jgi:hypothetical protein
MFNLFLILTQFFGPILKKYGVDYTVEARREYKSALSSLTDAAWNEPTRQNLQDLVWSLQSQTLLDLHYRGLGIEERLPIHIGPPVILATENPILYAIESMKQTMRDEQPQYRELLAPLMDLLNSGPFSAPEAIKKGLIDGLGYHQELLAEFGNIGIKTWSLRKYCDSAIVQSIFSDIDMSRSVIPQLFKNKEKEKKKHDKEDQKKGHKADLRLDVSLVSEKTDPTLDDASLKVEIVVPRNIGLIYLDNEITGYDREI